MAFAIPIALMAASAAASASAARKQKKAAQSADTLAGEGRADWHRRNQENIDRLQLFAQNQYDPAQRAQKWDQAARTTENARNAELAAADSGPAISTGQPMDATQLAWAGSQAAEEGSRMRDVVRLLSKASAPQTAGFQEGIDSANAFSEYGSRAQDANNMFRAFGGEVDKRVGKIGTAGSSQNLLASLFAKGASMTSGGMAGAAGMGAHATTGIPSGYPHVG